MAAVTGQGVGRYPAYIDSNVSWLGCIPADWAVTYLKFQTRFTNGAPFKPSEWSHQGTPIIRIENLNGNEEFNRYDGDLEPKYEVHEGDLLFAWSGNIGTSFGPHLWSKPGVYYLNQHIFRLDGFGFHTRYFYWLLRAVTSFIESKTSGIIGLVHVTKPELGRIPIPLISPAEQSAIANFLDLRTEEIDRFISKKRMLIALFEEQRSAIISRAVCEGVDLYAPKRPSKLPWLGQIPSHWEERRAKYYFREIDDRSVSGKEELLSVSHLTGVTPRREKNITMFMAESYEGSKLCQIGDLVINIMWAWMGACGVSKYAGIVSPSYGVYRPKSDLFVDEYLDLLSRCRPYVAEYNCRSTGITSSRLRMYTDEFFSMPIVRPPLEEQRRIVDVIQAGTESINKAIRVIDREIALINEFRARLISDVITGKLNVSACNRDAAHP